MGKQKVYIVEDEIGIRLLLTEVMKQIGYDAQSFAHADEAIEAIHLAKPDILFVDFMIGNVSGDELVKTIQEDGFSIPTVIMSGRATSEIKEHFIDLRVDFFLEKPFNVDEVQFVLNQIYKNVINA